ncbi:YecA family protein [Solibacillus sp. FSL H8-0538]|uniref:YecA family protein n=1 Tax=Solibacillus sp. FSL H8-0538 TaxID=2921400 RepID=UPI0030F4DEE9
MIGRNDPCLCGSGKKYKKCCEGQKQTTVVSVFNEEIENTLQNFYSTYPESKDIREYVEIVQAWLPKLESHLQRELIEAVALDEFFFHKRPDVWTGYLKRTMKKMVRPATIALLESWTEPTFFIGCVESVEEKYFKATCILTDKSYMIRRENQKPIPEGMQVFAFLLPDGTGHEDHVLAVSTLIFFPSEHANTFDTFTKTFKASGLTAPEFVKANHLSFWMALVDGGYAGEEFTSFEQDVIGQVKEFLTTKDLDGERLLTVLEDYLVEQQPTARKAGAIAAGAIRFGQDRGLFDGKFTVKEIAESFGISASSLNKYHQELLAFDAVAV